ncbi:nuclear transport factor 2 family protein [bacterium]|nr:nuclear transport factor 2 family protein [bacterium]
MGTDRTLLHTFNDLKNALISGNTTKLDELIADAYRGFSLNGTVETKSDILECFTPGGVAIHTYAVHDMSCDTYDTVGIITGKGEIEGSFGSHTFHHHVLFTDIFIRLDSQWKYYKSQVTEIISG